MTIRAQNAKVRLMRGSEIVIMESVQREDGRCESFTEHDEPVMELHTECDLLGYAGFSRYRDKVSMKICTGVQEHPEIRWYRGLR